MKSFKDLKVWQEAHKLAILAYKVSKEFPKEEKYGLACQLRRASVSVSANIVEGNGRFYKKEGTRFLYIARGSLYEVESYILLAKDIGYISVKDMMKMKEQLEIVGKMINGLLKSIRVKNNELRTHELTNGGTNAKLY